MIKIAHISDTHITQDIHFNPRAYNLIANDINQNDFDLVVHTGDLTNHGLRDEYEYACQMLRGISKPIIIVPGNHDAQNVGYELFKNYIGPLYGVYEKEDIVIIWVDSTIPDLSDGRIGNYMFQWLKKKLKEYSHKKFKIVASHHHLVPLPDAGRERNTLYNAGDVLNLLLNNNVNLYLCGHKHVSNIYNIEGLIVVNAGCASCKKTRRGDVNSYNIVKLKEDKYIKVCIKKINRNYVERIYKYEKHKQHKIAKSSSFKPNERHLFRIVQMSGSYISDRVYFKRQILKNAIELINKKYKPDLVVHCGNIVDVGIERYYEIAMDYYVRINEKNL